MLSTIVEPLVPGHLSGQSLGIFACVYMYAHTYVPITPKFISVSMLKTTNLPRASISH